MKNILAAANLPLLHAFARQRVLVAFDFDGTLAPVVQIPAAAGMRARTRALLAKVAELYPCVVISGRARADVRKKLLGLSLRAVIGNHGMEPSRAMPAARKLTARWRAQLAAVLPKTLGVNIEDKGGSLAVHYRQARSRALVRQRILAAVTGLPGARIVEGKMVFDVLPVFAANKGTAVLGLCKRLHCESAIYVGDDDNDEDAFALAGRVHLLGIRVGRSPRSNAGYFLPRQPAVDRLLAELACVGGA